MRTIRYMWKRYGPLTVAALALGTAIIKLVEEFEDFIWKDEEWDDTD
jgi:hypothetical protein